MNSDAIACYQVKKTSNTGQPAVPDRVYSMANAINVQTKVEPQEAP